MLSNALLALGAGILAALAVMGIAGLRRERRIDAMLESIREEGGGFGQRNASGDGSGDDRLLEWLARVAPVSRDGKQAKHTRQLLREAGYESPRHLLLYRAAATVLLAGLTGASAVALLGLGTPPHPLVWPLVIAVAMLMAMRLPALWLTGRAKARKQALEEGLPELIDLLVICIEGGQSFDAALQRSGEELRSTQPVLGAELDRVNLAIRAGGGRAEALRDLAERTGLDELRDLTTMLIQADRTGVSLRSSLQTQAQTMRVLRLQRAEEAAAKLPVKLLAPLAICLLPALMMILFGPAVMQLSKTFGGS